MTCINLLKFEGRLTFLSDCATTMPVVLEDSIAQRKVPYGERWDVCITHKLDTATKAVMNSNKFKKSIIWKDLSTAISVVTNVKHIGLNERLIKDYYLIQEMET